MNRIACALLFAAVLAFAQQAHVNLDHDPQANRLNLKSYGGTLIYPEVHPGRRVTFHVSAPKAQEVLLTVGPAAPNIYVYKILSAGNREPETHSAAYLLVA